MVGPGRSDGDELERRDAGEHVADVLLAEVMVRGHDPELVVAVEMVHAGCKCGGRERDASERPPIGTFGEGARDVAEDGAVREQRIRVVGVEFRGMGGGAGLDANDAGEVADGERGVSQVSVDVDVAQVAGTRSIGDPGPDVREFAGFGLRLVERGGLGGDGRSGFRDEEVRLEYAVIEVPGRVRLVQNEFAVGRDVGGPDFGVATSWFPCEDTGLLDQFVETGAFPNSGKVRILFDDVRMPEAEFNGLVQFVKGVRRFPELGERAGEVVVPGGVAGQYAQSLSADYLHTGGVAALEDVGQLSAQLHVARPDLRHAPDGQRFLFCAADDCRGQEGKKNFFHAHSIPQFTFRIACETVF